MRNVKDFQERYNRWKNGERYWDIRGIDLPKYDNADKNTVITNDGSVFYVDPSSIGAKNLVVTTPEIEIIGHKPDPYQNTYDNINSIYNNIANTATNIPSLIQKDAYYMSKPFFDISNGFFNLVRSLHSNTNKTSDTPLFTDNGYAYNQVNPITLKRGKFPEGEVDKNFRRSILGDLGIVKGPDGYYHYYDNGEIVKQCAKFANHYSSMVGRPVAGDAWTARGIYGDSVIYNNPLKLPISKSVENELQNGDIVDLYWGRSPHLREAQKHGRGNSHTGRIFKPNNKDIYVIHNVSGKIKIQPFDTFNKWSDFLHPNRHFRIKQIRRPFTQYEKER